MTYKGTEKSILAVANFSDKEQTCSIHIDFKKLGYNPNKVSYLIPFIAGYLDAQKLSLLENLNVSAGKGYLIVIR